MKIYQAAQIVVGSDVFDPDQITARLALRPTSVSWRASRSVNPVIPITNLWKLSASRTGRVDDLLCELVDVLESIRGPLSSLTQNDASWVGICFVRRFNDSLGVEEELTAGAPEGLVKLAGQHQLLGFHLDTAMMARLVSLGCSVDVDEYG